MRLQAPAVAVVLLLVAGCSGGSSSVAAKPTASSTPSPAVVASKPPVPVLDLLTGTSPRSTGPLVGFKVDNALLARPYQTGLGRAAIVYEELVEGGSTRLLAIYESDLAGPGEVGPIRSVRESDVALIRTYGRLALAFSGGNSGVKAIVRAAARAGELVDASYDAISSAYRLGARRADARNFFSVPTTLAANRPGSGATDIGLRFGGLQPGGLPTASAISAYSTNSHVTVRYNAAMLSWSIFQDGRLMPGVGPANIIVQRVAETGSRFSDVHGQPTPYTVTTGSGSATILREGQRFAATWTRSGFGATHYTTAGNHDVLLRPGRSWVLLVPTSGSVTFG